MGGLSLHEIAEKAEVHLDLTDLDVAGRLNDYQLTEFKDLITEKSRLLADCKVEFVKQKKGKWEFAGLTAPVSFPVSEHTALDEAKYSELALDKVTFDCVDFAAALPLSDTVLRNNLMKERLGSYIWTRLGPRLGLDIERYALLSDTDSTDADLDDLDGLLTQSTTNVFSPGSAADIDDALFYAMRIRLDPKYWDDLENMRFYCSHRTEAAYQNYLKSEYSTPGFAIRSEDKRYALKVDGVPLFPLDLFPDGKVLLTHKDNIVIFLEEEVTYETEREPKKRRSLYHAHYAMDAKLAIEEATVLHTNVAIPVATTA